MFDPSTRAGRRSAGPGTRGPGWGVCLCLMILGETWGCGDRVHSLGYDDVASNGFTGADAEVASTLTADSAAQSSMDGSPSSAGGDVDAGADGGPSLPTPTNPPNVLVEVLGLGPTTVTTRLSALFERLFVSGNLDSERIFYELGTDGAYVLDVLHDDARMDAMGYGMLLTVQFDRPEAFARLWETVKTHFRYETGPRRGYFRFSCVKDFSECDEVIDSFGSFYAATALFLAADRWNDSSYYMDALEVLAAMRDKEPNGEPTEDVVNLFNEVGVPRRVPLVSQLGTVSPVSLMPAFFELWYVRTQDDFWHSAAESSRQLLLAISHVDTGLTPDIITETGEAVEMPAMFREESYPAAFHLALDASWFPQGDSPPEEYVRAINRMLGFFYRQSPTNYSALYEVDGTVADQKISMALIALNGAAAAIANLPSRGAFLQGAWDTTGPSGLYRFYDGVYQLLSLSFLGGELRVVF